MANLSEDIQCAGSDTRPPMLDRTDFASWQQRSRIYYQGKENGVNILKSIDEGPYQIGIVRDTLAESIEGAPQFGPERPRVYYDLSPEEKDRNIKMTMSRMQLNSKFVNNMLPEWGRFMTAVKLNRGLRDSNYDQLYTYLKKHKTHAKENKMMLERFSQNTVDPLALMSNVSNPQLYSPSSSTSSSTQVPQPIADNPHLDSNGQDNTFDDDVEKQPVQDLALNVDNVFQADDCDTFDSDVDKALTAQTMFMANLSSADPVTDEVGPSYDSNILSEVHDHDHYQDAACVHHEEHVMHDSVQLDHVVDSHADYTSGSNMIPYDQDNYAPAIVHNIEDTLEIAKITRKKMNAKMSEPKCVTRKVKIAPHDYSKENFLATFTPQKQLTPEQIFWSNDLIKLKSKALKEQTTVSRPIKALTEIPTKTCKKRIIPTGLTEGERGFEQTKECYLKEVIPFFKTPKDNFEGIQKALTKEIKEMKDVFEELEAEARCLALEAELANLRDKSHHDNQEELINNFSKLEVNHLNLQLKYQNLKDSLRNNPPTPDKDTPDFDSVFVIGKMQASLQRKDNVIRQLKKQLSQLQVTRSYTDRTLKVQTAYSHITKLTEQVTNLQAQNNLFRAKNDKIKLHYKELYDFIKITHAKHIEHVTAFTTKNVNLKAQTLEKVNSVSKDQVKPTVLAQGKHAIDVEPIVPRLRNNWDAHLDYLRYLKESVETIRDIVKEAKVVRPLDRSIVSACRYTKHSQELLEYAIGTCPQGSQQRAKQLAYIPLIRKKQVTFAKPSDKSDSTTHQHVVTVKPQQTNVPVPPSTGVNSCPNASRSQPKSNVKPNRISPAKGVNKLPVEDQPRTNKSHLRTSNHVDSSSRLKRTVINSNPDSICQTCNKCLTSSNHDMCVATHLRSVMATPIHHNCNVVRRVKQVWKPKQVRQVWKPTGKVLTTIGHQWRPTCRILNLGNQCPLTRKHYCYVRDTDGVELIKGSRGSSLYTNSVEDMMKSSPICLLSKASKNKSWLWHRRLNHLNFSTINDLARKDLVRGLPRLKFKKDHLCSACQLGKSKKHIHTPKTKNTNLEVLNTLHMELCGPVRVQTINEKKYILVIVDDYSLFTWVKILRSKDETPEVIIKFIQQIQVGLNKTVRYVHTVNGKEFVNHTLTKYYERPAPNLLTPGQISSGLVPNPVPATLYTPPTNKELEILFQPMFDEYLEPPRVERPVLPAQAVQAPVNSAGTPSSTTIDTDAPSPSISPSSSALQSHSLHQGVAAGPNYMEYHTIAPVKNTPFVNVFAPEPHSEASSSGDISLTESPYVSQTLHHLNKWSMDHPLDNAIGNPSRPVSTRKQLATDSLWCLYSSALSKVKPKNFKYAITEDVGNKMLKSFPLQVMKFPLLEKKCSHC
uniref:Integrase, catalytic region, zinc finger, CCHC-type, peptidase aspartic, catalytic n=1 Tax=Tanacetum cinerariifolium TaxID=118510 RepID=A0A6L2NQ26_TANCI|nr:integrase, catalytic region, zinc finger, CCHC-type, peptidase aspartic, catalytic [Tanacetum cinerariifolium]